MTALQWLRLPEAMRELSSYMSDADARAWLVRQINDQLRGDAARYQAQDAFRLPGYPMRGTSRGNYDWPAQTIEADVDFERSTIRGLHPLRLIAVDLILEISAETIKAKLRADRPVEAAIASQAKIQETVDNYFAADPNPTSDGAEGAVKAAGIKGHREFTREYFRTKMKKAEKPVRPGVELNPPAIPPQNNPPQNADLGASQRSI